MKKWEKPQIIVLVRGKPEESLFLSCKGSPQIQGPNAVALACYYAPDGCLSCQQWGES